MAAHGAESSKGLTAAIGAYLIWGLVLPVYLKALSHIPALEIVANRVIWAVPFVAGLLIWFGLFSNVRTFLTPRYLAMALLTATIISVNWSIYVYAILVNKAVEAALGYYINPLVSILLGAVFLGERPTRLQGAAIALASVGVVVMAVMAGGVPIISLGLALTFGSYGLLRKMMPFGAAEGFFLETLILILPACTLLVWYKSHGGLHFGDNVQDTLLLIGSGPVTAIPLILFASGARQLKLSTIGILQYMVPTLLVLTAVFVFGEHFGFWQLIAFCFIWTALALYSWSMFDSRKTTRLAVENNDG
ncbi:EamA family transporter RarD [Aureimonas fodinaquatilis]|uniref:EamA family transporter RarD n=1 Tax=Aureimonas fodinaquatilis TaxID=2565783 RepID=A0A5B0DW11_9HYPH|nr:EamA family transporter RarD [Aureimonas fodinaquatilis]KAA0971017.1 EamA family transporter RarD [Aureimonas fodinaquatilis]